MEIRKLKTIMTKAFRLRLSVLFVLLSISIQGFSQTEGKASFYGRTGEATASGIRFNSDSLYCAHLKYPFGTLLLVRNPANGREVVVKVIDRGPYIKGRIIDISRAAAERLGIVSKGVALVEVSEYSDRSGIPYASSEYHVPTFELEVNPGAGFLPAWQNKKGK